MSPTDRYESPSGGDETAIEATSRENASKRVVYRRVVRDFVVTPTRILWGDWRARVGLTIVGFYVLLGVLAVFEVVEPTYANDGPLLQAPFQSWEHPLGTDGLGQDMLAQTVHATPEILRMMFAGATFAVVLGTVVGLTAGYKGGRAERVLMTVADTVMTIPGLPLVIVLIVILGPPNPEATGVILAISAWASLARMLRSQVLTIREESYVEASRAMGLSTPVIVLVDVLPNLMPYIVVRFVESARTIVFAAVGLYFLGILPFSEFNWGVTIDMAYRGGALYSLSAAHWFLVPMIALVVLSYGLIVFGQSMDRLFNPRIRARHENGASEIDETEEQTGAPKIMTR